jgi:uncharacterized protein YcfJ
MTTIRMMMPAFAAVLLLATAGPVAAQDNGYRHHQVCKDVRVRNQSGDNHQIAGTAIGAVAGGLLGHQVGGGKGKTLATVGGAVAGGYAGHTVQKKHQENNAGYHIERRCHDVD